MLTPKTCRFCDRLIIGTPVNTHFCKTSCRMSYTAMWEDRVRAMPADRGGLLPRTSARGFRVI